MLQDPRMSPDIYRVYVFAGGISLMYFLESLFATRVWGEKHSRRLFIHLCVAALNGLVLRGLFVFIPLLYIADFLYQRKIGLSHLLGLHGVQEILASLVVLDFLDYWWHRWNHRVPFFWRFHKVHHVDTHCDTTTSLRFHTGELIFSTFIKTGWILIWGPSVWGFAIFESMITLAAQFHHANFRFPGWFEKWFIRFIVSPHFHASHHTITMRTRDNNFSTIFSWWDRLFGTFKEPNEEEMRHLGLERGGESYLSLKKTLLGPFLKDY